MDRLLKQAYNEYKDYEKTTKNRSIIPTFFNLKELVVSNDGVYKGLVCLYRNGYIQPLYNLYHGYGLINKVSDYIKVKDTQIISFEQFDFSKDKEYFIEDYYLIDKKRGQVSGWITKFDSSRQVFTVEFIKKKKIETAEIKLSDARFKKVIKVFDNDVYENKDNMLMIKTTRYNIQHGITTGYEIFNYNDGMIDFSVYGSNIVITLDKKKDTISIPDKNHTGDLLLISKKYDTNLLGTTGYSVNEYNDGTIDFLVATRNETIRINKTDTIKVYNAKGKFANPSSYVIAVGKTAEKGRVLRVEGQAGKGKIHVFDEDTKQYFTIPISNVQFLLDVNKKGNYDDNRKTSSNKDDEMVLMPDINEEGGDDEDTDSEKDYGEEEQEYKETFEREGKLIAMQYKDDKLLNNEEAGLIKKIFATLYIELEFPNKESNLIYSNIMKVLATNDFIEVKQKTEIYKTYMKCFIIAYLFLTINNNVDKYQYIDLGICHDSKTGEFKGFTTPEYIICIALLDGIIEEKQKENNKIIDTVKAIHIFINILLQTKTFTYNVIEQDIHDINVMPKTKQQFERYNRNKHFLTIHEENKNRRRTRYTKSFNRYNKSKMNKKRGSGVGELEKQMNMMLLSEEKLKSDILSKIYNMLEVKIKQINNRLKKNDISDETIEHIVITKRVYKFVMNNIAAIPEMARKGLLPTQDSNKTEEDVMTSKIFTILIQMYHSAFFSRDIRKITDFSSYI